MPTYGTHLGAHDLLILLVQLQYQNQHPTMLELLAYTPRRVASC